MSKTVRELLVQATAYLKDISDTPRLEARILLERATGFSQVQTITKSEEQISSDSLYMFQQMLSRRLNHEPMAYILGEREFYGRDFKVTKDTLIPRPDTETLVEIAINYINSLDYRPSVLDLCTGTGCVGISVAAECDCDIALADISTKALECAKYNAESLLNQKTDIIETNLFSNCKIYDIIVSNPPYLTHEWCEEASEEVQKEPRLALEGFSEDGLSLIRDIVKDAPSHLSGNKSALFIECDYRQTLELKKILEDTGFTEVKIYKDLNGKQRVVGGTYVRTIN
jgi:release factor glutamine methyltransferase